ncbi:hypothetical protein Pedsa_2635 [Pseudopedobacter saltans DSM 12145]|uniref:PKD domain-containing protein n=1 Tax=Pseudopedobacter saltans (strain ATCC 51119 / DSM 12145 / JCM 21818 / CCUG 39354 / LMG 10337 / NBRC 100064 / NCIMB 13643) TaxID=762903 RepID=F0S663_PSESL|nr:hypothetical protein [Pseudopedobacter saltans]ADY53177.1 hypothetical protein Pedsa_2635 [Pseudopedobacter saltans DSM 12145]
MKNIFLIMAIVLFSASACKKSISLEDPIAEEDINIIVQETETPNVYRFINGQIGNTAKAKWNLGNSEEAVGDTVIGKYPFKGNYTVKLSVFNGIKIVDKSIQISFKNDNLDLDPVYGFLTGGPNATNGKTWVLDSLIDGHVKLVNNGSTTPWNKLAKTNKGVYDDELTFKLAGKECLYKNNGNSYCHGGTIDGVTQFRLKELNANWGTVTSSTADGGDLMINYTPKDAVQHWEMEIRGGKHYLQLKGGAFFFFYRGISNVIEYEINSINENEMVVTHYETAPASRAASLWRDQYTLIRKGYQRP